jgi:hypothetical protein
MSRPPDLHTRAHDISLITFDEKNIDENIFSVGHIIPYIIQVLKNIEQKLITNDDTSYIYIHNTYDKLFKEFVDLKRNDEFVKIDKGLLTPNDFKIKLVDAIQKNILLEDKTDIISDFCIKIFELRNYDYSKQVSIIEKVILELPNNIMINSEEHKIFMRKIVGKLTELENDMGSRLITAKIFKNIAMILFYAINVLSVKKLIDIYVILSKSISDVEAEANLYKHNDLLN